VATATSSPASTSSSPANTSSPAILISADETELSVCGHARALTRVDQNASALGKVTALAFDTGYVVP